MNSVMPAATREQREEKCYMQWHLHEMGQILFFVSFCVGGGLFGFLKAESIHKWEVNFAEKYLPTFLWLYGNPSRVIWYKIGGLVFIAFGLFGGFVMISNH